MARDPETAPYPPAKWPQSSRAEEGTKGLRGARGRPCPGFGREQDPLQKGHLRQQRQCVQRLCGRKGPLLHGPGLVRSPKSQRD